MADTYVRSTDGNDADDGLTWANADAFCAAALTAAGSGGRVFMSDNHAETTAGSVTLASPGVSGSVTAIICVDDTGDPEPPTALALTGSVSTTGATNISHSGHAAGYGFTENVASAGSAGNLQAASATSWYWQFRACVLVLRGSGGTSRILAGSTSSTMADALMEWFATDLQFNGAAQAINPATTIRWYGGSITAGGVSPTGGLIKTLAGTSMLFEGRGLDLSNLGNNPLVSLGTGCMGGYIDFLNFETTSGATLFTGTIPGPGMPRVRAHHWSSPTFTGVHQEACYEGTVSSETFVHREGGASAFGTGYAVSLTSNANTSFYVPLCMRFAIPVSAEDTSMTLTVEMIHDSATALHNGDVWLELESPGAVNEHHIFTNGRRAILPTTTSDWASSSATWANQGEMVNPNKQKMTVTLTPAQPGVWYLRVCLAKASHSVYIDPPQRAQIA